jgi:hypothetical protein
MPQDAELISAFSELQGNAAQKWKQTNSFIANLNSLIMSLDKTGKSLALRGQASEIDAGLAQALGEQTITDTAKASFTQAKRDAKQLDTLKKNLAKVIDALKAERINVQSFATALNTLQTFETSLPDLADLLPHARQILATAEQELATYFGDQLNEAMAQHQVTISGRAPNFEIGRFALRVDAAKRKAALSYGKIAIEPSIALNIPAVVRAWQAAHKAIFARTENPEQWMAQLYEAWVAARRYKGTNDRRISIVDCYVELVLQRQKKDFRASPSKKIFRDYSRAQFAHDFYEIAVKRHLAHKGEKAFAHVATKGQVEQDRSIWLVTGDSPAEGAFYADIEFNTIVNP